MALSKLTLVFLGIFFYSFSSLAQNNVWLIRFTDKNNSVYSVTQPNQFLSQRALDRRTRFSIPVTYQDLPVNETYLDGLRAEGAVVRYSLRWMNAAVIVANSTVMAQVNALPYVIQTNQVKRTAANTIKPDPVIATQRNAFSDEASGIYGYAFDQNKMVGVELLHEDNFHGEGMLIAVFDEGFINYNSLPAFQSLVNRNAFVFTYDVIDSDFTVNDTGGHGLGVLSILAADDPGNMVGPAYMADYMLFRTEDGTSESPLEELNWARAAEMADSAGVDIIHSSLGYSTFDNSSYNYGYSSMNGYSSIITQAADKAGYRGILVVTSAGNEGTNSWHYITAPADGDSVLAVGATTDLYQPAAFSSYGPTYDNRNKPDVSAMGNNAAFLQPGGNYGFGSGTSLAAPLITGLAACIWQANPELSNMKLIQLIREAGHIYPAYDKQMGYGVPDYHRVRFHIENGFTSPACILAPNPVKHGDYVQLYLAEPFRNKSTLIKIYDVTGRQMADYTYTPDQVRESLRLETTFLSGGLYTVEVITNFTVSRIKFEVY